MMLFLIIAVCLLGSNPCSSRAVDESSVVSDYTPSKGALPSVYSQIATNIADRVTQPIYRFLGINQTTTKRPFEHIELDERDQRNNTIERDVEELSDSFFKPHKRTKPEKISLFPRYLPFPEEKNSKLEGTNKYSEEFEIVDTNNNEDAIKDEEKITKLLPSNKNIPELYNFETTKVKPVENIETNEMNNEWHQKLDSAKPRANLDVANITRNRHLDDTDKQTSNIINNTVTESKNVSEDDDDDFDDEFSFDNDVNTNREQRGPFISFLELLGSIIQLIWGAFLALFNKPETRTSDLKIIE